jgi:hypothetical protein
MIYTYVVRAGQLNNALAAFQFACANQQEVGIKLMSVEPHGLGSACEGSARFEIVGAEFDELKLAFLGLYGTVALDPG